MFCSYQKDFRNQLQIKGDDDNDEVNRRCAYTQEHKLAAIDYAINTWERQVTSELVHISRYFAARKLKIHTSVLTRWIKSKQKILSQKRGGKRLRLLKEGKEPEMEKKLNIEFKTARRIERQITHR
jgi:hypothetical protein